MSSSVFESAEILSADLPFGITPQLWVLPPELLVVVYIAMTAKADCRPLRPSDSILIAGRINECYEIAHDEYSGCVGVVFDLRNLGPRPLELHISPMDVSLQRLPIRFVADDDPSRAFTPAFDFQEEVDAKIEPSEAAALESIIDALIQKKVRLGRRMTKSKCLLMRRVESPAARKVSCEFRVLHEEGRRTGWIKFIGEYPIGSAGKAEAIRIRSRIQEFCVLADA